MHRQQARQYTLKYLHILRQALQKQNHCNTIRFYSENVPLLFLIYIVPPCDFPFQRLTAEQAETFYILLIHCGYNFVHCIVRELIAITKSHVSLLKQSLQWRLQPLTKAILSRLFRLQCQFSLYSHNT